MNSKTIGKSVFLKTFGDSPMNKILDFLIVFESFDYSMADIAEKANVGYSTLKILLPQLEKKKIIKCTRITGKSKMYKLNLENPIVAKFKEFYWEITNQIVKNSIKEKQIPA